MLSSTVFYAFAWLLATVNAQFYPVTGVQTGIQNGARPFRRDIYDLQQNYPRIFSLYIQALARMESANTNDQLSWLQVAGIHGRPYVPWNGAQQAFGAPRTGYCPHSSPLFATWHRPYLATVEQIMGRHAQDIAQLYPPSLLADYQDAANNFRLPYWDWAVNPDIPPITTVQNIEIETPTGLSTIRNPLYSYRFPQPLNPSQFPTNQDSGFGARSETSRQDTTALNNRLRSENFMQRTWKSLAKSQTFNGWSTSSNPGTSIEAVHNSVHGDFIGHMSALSYSAFDPIFWLHHVNVDRLTALFQCIRPTYWLTSTTEPQGTFSIRQFQFIGGSTTLAPFTNANGQYYTSDSSRYLAPFGYAYAEVIDWNQTTSQLQNTCLSHLYRLYNPNNTFTKRKRSTTTSNGRRRRRSAAENEQRTWTVSIKVSKFDYPDPFIVRVFLDEPAGKPQEWYADRGHIGSLYVNQPGDKEYYKEAMQREVVVYDEFDIDDKLADMGIDGDDVEATTKLLGEKLVWKVVTHNGTIIPLEQIESLKISVAEEMITLARQVNELPSYGKRVLHPEVTKGKLGGFTGNAAG